MANYGSVKYFFEDKGFNTETEPQKDGRFKFYKVRPQCHPDHLRALFNPEDGLVELATRISIRMSSEYVGGEIKENLTQALEPVRDSLQDRVNDLVQNDDVAIKVSSPNGTTQDMLFYAEVKAQGRDPQEVYTRLQHILKERFGYRI